MSSRDQRSTFDEKFQDHEDALFTEFAIYWRQETDIQKQKHGR
jgi:hypothetical protein